MAALGELVVNLSANVAEFNRNMAEASQRTEAAARRMSGMIDTVRSSVIALGAGATIGAFAVMVKGAIDAADNLRDMSQKTGIAVETLNGLGFAAGQAGGSLESMVSAAGKLNKVIAEAGGGNKEASEAFKALGINIRDASGNLKKADVITAEIADKFEKFSDGPEKSALALRLFGKAGADMIPLLNDGGNALRENVEYAKQYSAATTELSAAADNFNDTLGKLAIQQKGFVNSITSAVMPVIQAVADELLGAAEGSNKFSLAGEVARTVLETFVIVGSEVVFTFKAVGTEIGGIAAQLGALAHGDMKGFSAISDAMKVDAEKARKEHDAFIAKVLDRTPAQAAVVAVANKPAAPGLPGQAKQKTDAQRESERIQREGAQLVARLKEQDEAYGLSGAALLSYQLKQSKIPQSLKAEAMAHQINIDAMKAAQEQRTAMQDALQKMEDEERVRREQNEANVQQIKQSLMTELEAETAMHEARIAELQAFHDEKLENVTQANLLLEAEDARHKEVMGEMDRRERDMKTATQQSIVSLMSESSNQLYDVLQQAGLEQTAIGKAAFLATKAMAVAQIILNTNVAASAALAAPPIGLGPIGGMGLAATIKGMGYASAAMTAGLAIAGAREKGGPVWSGGTFLVGEKGPELFTPSTGGTIIPNDALTGGGRGGITINNSPQINIDSRADQQEVRRMVADGVARGNADLVDRLSRAGRI